MKIKVTSPSFSKNLVLRQELSSVFADVVYNEVGQRLEGEALVSFLSDADGAVIGLEPITRDLLSKLPRLKILSKYGVGLDNVDLEAARSLDKVIGWTGGVNKRSVSEQALAFMIGLARNLFFTSFSLKKGAWNKEGGYQLSGKTVGIIGCGHIGTDVTRLLAPFECSILIHDILDKSEVAKSCKGRQVSFEELLTQSDLVTLHVPLTDKTYHMINQSSLALMKSTSFLINTSRGPVVKHEALKEALQKSVIAGAALDVFESEPPTDLEFLSLPNLMVTPHIGGNAVEAVMAMGRSAIGHLKSYFGLS